MQRYLTDEDVLDYSHVDHAMEMLDLIEEYEKVEPRDKRSRSYKEWRVEKINMHKHYNKIVGFNALKTNI